MAQSLGAMDENLMEELKYIFRKIQESICSFYNTGVEVYMVYKCFFSLRFFHTIMQLCVLYKMFSHNFLVMYNCIIKMLFLL